MGEQSKIARIKEMIIKALTRVEERSIRVFWVSELAQCLRKSFYERKYPVPPNEAMVMGRETHEVIANKLKIEEFEDAVYGVKAVAKIEDITIRGEADIVTPEAVIELKVSKDPRLKEYYVRQVCYYKKMLGKQEAYVAIIHSGSLNVSVYKIENCYEDLEKRAQTLFKHLVENKLPEAERGEWCGICPFTLKCLKDQK
jgi:CRISPR/Cas system-associated exonuclease Cas4 (RecB family)